MTAMNLPGAYTRPPVHLIDSEYDALNALAQALEYKHPQVSALLLAELDRAQVHEAADLPEGVVSMNGWVEFIDERSGTQSKVQLVYPHQADIAFGRISITTPVGASLIGLSAGDAIMCRYHDGQQRLLRIVSVERSGAEQRDAAVR
ncbi:nucleoside diphosphate kinase regulator [Hyphomonas johnsonii]|jgi:regulator of nucleoside diphosphate kinase|uniref:GreA/GreB family elongation factor n=1 Tax=Hyphomonas johnsonii MHS-2 TaxID=1280950 RepID=A0A059FQ95_9PROT|nr:nucleoside diphosphate kinase regulator [Hyphomonas johnsonii]KCZ92829.1 GreA/GreB family elongation factor [Hyphomonas johnsonii MHS-2]